MTSKSRLAGFNCSLARALSVIGDPWSILILRDALLGVRRFTDFERSLGVARNILTDRLATLVAGGVLQRSGTMRRPTYALTEKGLDLVPALIAMMQWGDRWQSERPPIEFVDNKGQPIAKVALRSGRGRPITAEALRARAGIGADQRTRAFLGSFADRE